MDGMIDYQPFLVVMSQICALTVRAPIRRVLIWNSTPIVALDCRRGGEWEDQSRNAACGFSRGLTDCGRPATGFVSSSRMLGTEAIRQAASPPACMVAGL